MGHVPLSVQQVIFLLLSDELYFALSLVAFQLALDG